jgi:integrase
MMESATKTFELDQRTFRDGHIVLYRRPKLKRPKWQCRISVPNATGYVRRSTGFSDEFEARRFAEDLYEDLRAQKRNGGAIQKPKFEKVFLQFKERYRTEAPSKRRYEEVISTIERYGIPFFKGRAIDSINNALMQDFMDWRRNNSKRAMSSPATINKDLTSLKTLFKWLFRNGIVDRPIEFDKPRVKQNRRTHFDASDWATLTRFLREWVKQGKSSEGGGKTRERVLLTNYALILANTGIRVGEARGLRWRDVHADTDKNRSSIVVLSVKGKTGEREVIARNFEVWSYFERIREMREAELKRKVDRDEFIFCNREGEPIGSFKKGFQNMIAKAGVEYDTYRQRRTIYSLRHTYATFRLQEGTHQFLLAQNMGTSVKMLEDYYGHVRSRDVAEELTKTSARRKSNHPKI